MSKHPEKDFGPIANDYVFFENHATEAEQDARAYVARLQNSVPTTGIVRMLDFGCGSGTFTARFLTQAGWPPERLQLTLVEPVEAVRRQAVARLAGLTTSPVAESATLPTGLDASFDLILANHVFYYVPELQSQLAALLKTRAPTGVFLTAMAARTNALIEFWIAGFRLLGREVPYNTSEDVEAVLQTLGANYHKEAVPYELTFPDTVENRLRILRFLLSDYLTQMPQPPLLGMFERYRQSGQIVIRTASDHFTIR